MISLRGTSAVSSFNPFLLIVRAIDDDDDTRAGSTDSALVYSYVVRETDEITVTAGSGIGFAEQIEQDPERVVSLPIDVRVLYQVSSYTGIGMHGYASLNRERSFGGAAVSLILGRTR